MPPSRPNSGADIYPFSSLKGGANVLIFPDLNSANIACKLLSTIGGGETLGPILMGMSKPVHLLPRGAEVEEIVNVVAIAVVDARESTSAEAAPWSRNWRIVTEGSGCVRYLHNARDPILATYSAETAGLPVSLILLRRRLRILCVRCSERSGKARPARRISPGVIAIPLWGPRRSASAPSSPE